jgi:hypothetical protein
MTMAPALIEAARCRFDRLLADRGYDSNAIRTAIAAQGAEVVIPSIRSRKTAIPYDRDAYRTQPGRTSLVQASKTGGASQHATTSSPPTTWLASSSPPSLPAGAIESGP